MSINSAEQVLEFALPADDWAEINVNRGAKVISAANWQGVITVYATANPTAALVKRLFRVVRVGQQLDLPVNSVLVGTVPFYDGAIVLHVFDCGERG